MGVDTVDTSSLEGDDPVIDETTAELTKSELGIALGVGAVVTIGVEADTQADWTRLVPESTLAVGIVLTSEFEAGPSVINDAQVEYTESVSGSRLGLGAIVINDSKAELRKSAVGFSGLNVCVTSLLFPCGFQSVGFGFLVTVEMTSSSESDHPGSWDSGFPFLFPSSSPSSFPFPFPFCLPLPLPSSLPLCPPPPGPICMGGTFMPPRSMPGTSILGTPGTTMPGNAGALGTPGMGMPGDPGGSISITCGSILTSFSFPFPLFFFPFGFLRTPFLGHGRDPTPGGGSWGGSPGGGNWRGGINGIFGGTSGGDRGIFGGTWGGVSGGTWGGVSGGTWGGGPGGVPGGVQKGVPGGLSGGVPKGGVSGGIPSGGLSGGLPGMSPENLASRNA